MKIHIEKLTIELDGHGADCASTPATPDTQAISNSTPKIGDAWPGVDGIYAGLSRGEGEPDAHLVLLNAATDKDMDWKDAKAWAESVGGRLPTRFESSLLYASLQDKMDKERAHWTSSQFSSLSAWFQTFSLGYQDTTSKDDTLRARAVSRFPL